MNTVHSTVHSVKFGLARAAELFPGVDPCSVGTSGLNQIPCRCTKLHVTCVTVKLMPSFSDRTMAGQEGSGSIRGDRAIGSTHKRGARALEAILGRAEGDMPSHGQIPGHYPREAPLGKVFLDGLGWG